LLKRESGRVWEREREREEKKKKKKKKKMWIAILQELGVKFNPYDYSGEEQDDSDDGGDQSQLDEIPEEVRMCLRKNALHSAAEKLCEPLEVAAAVAQSEKRFKEHVKPMSRPPQKTRRCITKVIFLACLLLLTEWRMLEARQDTRGFKRGQCSSQSRSQMERNELFMTAGR